MNAMEVNKYIVTEALSAILEAIVKLQSECKDLDKATELQITNLTALALLENEAFVVQPVTCLATTLTRTVAYKCKTNHNSENKITNYKRKCKSKKQNNNSENTTTIPKTL